MEHSNVTKVWQALEIVKGEPKCAFQGICSHISNNTNFNLPLRRTFIESQYEAWKCWPKYSGVPDYPVPNEGLSPYSSYNHEDDLWDKETTYGKNRWELLDHLIQWYKERNL